MNTNTPPPPPPMSSQNQNISTNSGNPQVLEDPRLNAHWKEEFTKFENDPAYKGKWNWPAFFFGGFWLLFKGLWKSFLIIMALVIVVGIILEEFIGLPSSATTGLGIGIGFMIAKYATPIYYYKMKFNKDNIIEAMKQKQ